MSPFQSQDRRPIFDFLSTGVALGKAKLLHEENENPLPNAVLYPAIQQFVDEAVHRLADVIVLENPLIQDAVRDYTGFLRRRTSPSDGHYTASIHEIGQNLCCLTAIVRRCAEKIGPRVVEVFHFGLNAPRSFQFRVDDVAAVVMQANLASQLDAPFVEVCRKLEIDPQGFFIALPDPPDSESNLSADLANHDKRYEGWRWLDAGLKRLRSEVAQAEPRAEIAAPAIKSSGQIAGNPESDGHDARNAAISGGLPPNVTSEKPTDLVSLKQVADVSGIPKPRLSSVASKSRRQTGHPMPAIPGAGSRGDYYSYAKLVPWLKDNWPHLPVPATHDEAMKKLVGRKEHP